MKISDALASVSPERRDDAIWLLTALLSVSRSALLLDAQNELTPAQRRAWLAAWKRRRSGEPMQYIVGSAPFWGRELGVRRGVLIPRPETERLVELCLGLLEKQRGARVLDIGTGSGAIALTLKLERPDLEVTASDLSRTALAQAERNARQLGADVALVRASLFSRELQGQRWELVVSNPPYLEFGKDKITPEVRRWEPRMALEPTSSLRKAGQPERAAWAAVRILEASEKSRPRFTALELSPRVAAKLERQWRSHPAVERAWREADLAGRKRFLLIAWRHA